MLDNNILDEMPINEEMFNLYIEIIKISQKEKIKLMRESDEDGLKNEYNINKSINFTTISFDADYLFDKKQALQIHKEKYKQYKEANSKFMLRTPQGDIIDLNNEFYQQINYQIYDDISKLIEQDFDDEKTRYNEINNLICTSAQQLIRQSANCMKVFDKARYNSIIECILKYDYYKHFLVQNININDTQTLFDNPINVKDIEFLTAVTTVDKNYNYFKTQEQNNNMEQDFIDVSKIYKVLNINEDPINQYCNTINMYNKICDSTISSMKKTGSYKCNSTFELLKYLDIYLLHLLKYNRFTKVDMLVIDACKNARKENGKKLNDLIHISNMNREIEEYRTRLHNL